MSVDPADKAESSDERRTRLERLDLEECAKWPDDDGWSEKIDQPNLSRSFWDDPEKGVRGVLGADRIRAYHYEVGRMIRPFQEEHLNSASYDLTLGPRYVLDGKERTLTVKRRILRIPPSSIAMVTSREILLMPHWLVATFNLKSNLIFDGLLMGAGPQIDPGFKGVLTCPLHNVSSKTVEIEFCKPFAKLDFVKTTWGQSVSLSDIRSEEDLYEKSEAGELIGCGGETVKLWPEKKNFRPPVSHLAGSAGSKSSLRGLEESSKRLDQKVGRIQLANIGVGVALAGLLFAVASLLMSYTDGRVEDVRNDRASSLRVDRSVRIQRVTPAAPPQNPEPRRRTP
jgi:deoxycytidine triphosphate deaminase